MNAPAFPALANLARAARATRGASRVARATVTALSALGEARLARGRNRHARTLALSAAAADMCDVHGLSVDVVGALPTRPCVLVANHVSYLDPLAILGQAPATPIAKAEVSDWPLIGPTIGSLGALFVRRADPMARARTLRGALAALQDGVSVLNFPEGTTTDGTRLLPFHRGIFGLAMLAQVPVVPIALRFEDPTMAWTGNATFFPHYWRMSTIGVGRVRLVVRAPMWARASEAPEDFAARVRSAIALSLDRVTLVSAATVPWAPTRHAAPLQETA